MHCPAPLRCLEYGTVSLSCKKLWLRLTGVGKQRKKSYGVSQRFHRLVGATYLYSLRQRKRELSFSHRVRFSFTRSSIATSSNISVVPIVYAFFLVHNSSVKFQNVSWLSDRLVVPDYISCPCQHIDKLISRFRVIPNNIILDIFQNQQYEDLHQHYHCYLCRSCLRTIHNRPQ